MHPAYPDKRIDSVNADYSDPIYCWQDRRRGGKLERADSPPAATRPAALEIMLEQSTAEDAQAQLLVRIAGGDLQALSDFYDRLAGPLFSVALRILGNPTEAEEIVQDAFVQIWEKASTFDPLLGSAFHWALSITRHRAIDRLRSCQRRARLVEELQERAGAGPAAMAPPDTDTLMIEEAKAVRSALSSLPQEQRQALELAFLGGLTHAEIAELLHQPMGTIKARIRRGLLKLRDSLQQYS